MPDTLPCPFCKSPIAVADADARGKVSCAMCLHEFLVRGQRLLDWVDPSDRAVAPPIYDEAETVAFTTAAPEPPPALVETDRPTHGRRRRPESRPASRVRRESSKKAVWIVLGLVVLVVGGLIGTVALFEATRRPARPGPFVFQNNNIQPVIRPPVFFDDRPLTEELIKQQATGFFASFRDALQFPRQADLMAHVNTKRIHDEFIALGGQAGAGEWRSVEILNRFVGDTLVLHADFLKFDEFEILHVKKLSDIDVQVTMRRWKNGGRDVHRTRYWLTKFEGSWKLYDFEDLAGHFRYLTLLAELSIGSNQQANLNQRLDTLQLAVNALATDLDAADRHLQNLGIEPLPAKYECLRHLAKGEIYLRRLQKPREAVDELEKCRQIDPEKPRADFLEAYARNDLREFTKALECVDRYRKKLENDGDICYEAALALRGLNRFPDAVVQIRKSLDYSPKNANVFLLLLQTLDFRDPRTDLGSRFAKLERPGDHFESFAQDCLKAKDWNSLDKLAKKMAQIDPVSPAPEFYVALIELNQNKIDQAMPRIRKALAREQDEQLKNNYWERFVQSMVGVGKAQDAYKLAPDPKNAFRLVGEELQKTYRMADLRKLIAVHKKTHPGDPLIPLFQAQLCAIDGEHEKAETLFAEAIDKRADDFLIGQAHRLRVANRYRLGKAMSAYEEIGPKDLTFTELSQLAWEDRNGKVLEEIVEAHEAFNPGYKGLGRVRCRAKLLAKKGDEAAAAFKTFLDGVRDKDPRRMAVEDFTYDCIDTEFEMVAYRSSPEPRQTFQRIASDFLAQARRDKLVTLLAVHRKAHPTDPWLDFYQAQIHLDDRAWGQAAASIAKAWNGAKMDDKMRIQHAYYFAMVKGGLGLKAHKDAADKNKAFVDVGRQMIALKLWAELDQLIVQHPRPKRADPDTLVIHARAKIAAKNIDGAAALLKIAIASQPSDALRRGYVAEFVGDLADKGLGIEGYRLVADKSAAFDTLAFRLHLRKQFDLLEALVREHAKTYPNDPTLPRFRGDIALERGDYTKAEAEYRAGSVGTNAHQWLCKVGIQRARVKAGKALTLYKETADDAQAFFNIADQCVREKEAAQLKAVVDEYRKIEPDDPLLPRFDLEYLVLKKDDAGVLVKHAEIVKGPRKFPDEQFLSDRLVRALIHLKKIDEANKVALEAGKKRYSDRLLPVLVAAATGNVDKTIAAIEKSRPTRFNLQHYYQDQDLGPMLRADGFRAVRERFPEPPQNEFDNGRFQDDFFD